MRPCKYRDLERGRKSNGVLVAVVIMAIVAVVMLVVGAGIAGFRQMH